MRAKYCSACDLILSDEYHEDEYCENCGMEKVRTVTILIHGEDLRAEMAEEFLSQKFLIAGPTKEALTEAYKQVMGLD